jgi:phosphopantetheinyl transferase
VKRAFPKGRTPSPALLGRRLTVRVAEPWSSGAETVVDVWYVRRDDDATRLEAVADVLAPAERAAARARSVEADRRLYVTAHVALRTVLASVVAAHPTEIDLRPDALGKPRLAGAFGGLGVEFSLSHSGGLVLLAVTRGIAVGVDVEREDGRIGMRELEGSFLTLGERRDVGALAEPERTQRLFRVWTRKEAVLKAIGCGLAASPIGLEVGTDADVRARLVRVPGADRSYGAVVEDLPCAKGYAASVALAAPRATSAGHRAATPALAPID